jgi:two-component system OmpR family sensor kinase
MTIRLRLTIFWAGLFALLLVAAGIAVITLFQRQQWGRLDGALMEEADTAAETIARLGPGVANQTIARLSEERDLGPSRRVWLVIGTHKIADAGDRRADPPMLENRTITHAAVDGGNRLFRYAIVSFRLNGAQAYIADGVDAGAVRDSIRRLRNSLLLVLPALLLASVSAGYWLAGRGLAPLVTITGALAEISPRDLSRRLSSSPIEDEVARLVREINSLLARIERASAAERRFAADAAHELRTPLAVLRSGIEIALGRERSAPEYAEALSSALRDVVTLCGMADELLTLARLDQEISAGREAVDLSALTREVVEAIEPLAGSKRLALEANLAPGVTVQGNRDHLRRVTINLLDNAIKFSPANGGIAVVLQSYDGRVILRVADSGPGIAQADLPFIFDRFFRGRGSREPGNGLGLSLCREIVELHGGQIAATNRAGGGAEFVVVLPVSPA